MSHAPQRPKHKHTEILIGIIGAVLLLLVVAANAGSHPQASQVSSTKPITTPAQTPSTRAEAISAWQQKYGPDFANLSSDMSALITDEGNLNYSGILADCDKLQADTTADMNVPAIPDAAVATHLSSALTYSQQSAAQCSMAITDYNDGNISQATSEINTSNSDLESATIQLDEASNTIKQASSQS